MMHKSKKAQLSLDALFTILFAIIFFYSLTILSSQVVSLQEDTAVRIQLKEISLNAAQLVASAQALGDGTYSLEYNIPMIAKPGTGSQKCTLSLIGNEIVASLGGIEEKSPVPQGTTVPSLPTDCGEILVING